MTYLTQQILQKPGLHSQFLSFALISLVLITFQATPASAQSTGTPNKIPKWTDSTGTLGDSNIFENADGNVGIGTTAPGYILDTSGRIRIRGAGGFGGGMWLSDSAAPTTDVSYIGRGVVGGTGIFAGGNWRFAVLDSGNVSIGTITPGSLGDSGAPVIAQIHGGSVYGLLALTAPTPITGRKQVASHLPAQQQGQRIKGLL